MHTVLRYHGGYHRQSTRGPPSPGPQSPRLAPSPSPPALLPCALSGVPVQIPPKMHTSFFGVSLSHVNMARLIGAEDIVNSLVFLVFALVFIWTHRCVCPPPPAPRTQADTHTTKVLQPQCQPDRDSRSAAVHCFALLCFAFIAFPSETHT